jgi:hypothetical protein
MSKQIELELTIGLTYDAENIHYSMRHVLQLLAQSGFPRTIVAAVGTEDDDHPVEDTSIINIVWNESTQGKVEEFCECLSKFLGKVATEMHQRWVMLKGFAFIGNSAYRIYMELDPFKRFIKEPRWLQPDDFFNWPLVFQGARTEPSALVEQESERLLQAAMRTGTLAFTLNASGSADSREFPQADDLEHRLRNYYGEKRCVIDGNLDNSTSVNWIPFDGDIAHLGFKSLVPVGHRHLLQAISPRVRGKLSNRFCFSVDLTAEHLLCQSKKHFRTGMPALAFGCARLGEALALEGADEFETQDDDGWAFLSQCLFYLPYRMNGDLLEITLRRVMRWLKKGSPCPYARRSALLLSIANLYQDMGDWSSAKNLYDQILSSPGLKPKTEAATLRRRMIGRFFTGTSEGSLLKDIPYIADLNSNIDFLVSLAIAQGWWHIARDRPRRCLSILKPFDSDEDDSMRKYSPHNIFELKLTQAAAYKALGLRSNVTPILEEVRRHACTLSYTRLRPIVTDRIAPVVFGYELVRAIAPLSSTFVVTPSMPELLNGVANALLKAHCTEITGRPTWVD